MKMQWFRKLHTVEKGAMEETNMGTILSSLTLWCHQGYMNHFLCPTMFHHLPMFRWQSWPNNNMQWCFNNNHNKWFQCHQHWWQCPNLQTLLAIHLKQIILMVLGPLHKVLIRITHLETLACCKSKANLCSSFTFVGSLHVEIVL